MRREIVFFVFFGVLGEGGVVVRVVGEKIGQDSDRRRAEDWILGEEMSGVRFWGG